MLARDQLMPRLTTLPFDSLNGTDDAGAALAGAF
jgi:hypothetical protein